MSKRKYMKNPAIFVVPVTAKVVINLEVVASTLEDAKALVDDYVEDDFSNVTIDDLNPFLLNGKNVLKYDIVEVFNESIERKD